VKRLPSSRACVALSVAALMVATALVMPAIASAQSAPPETIITQAPSNPTSIREAAFSFTGVDDTTRVRDLDFHCRLDPQNAPPGTDPLDLWLDCLSPQFFTELVIGQHTFEVQAIDQDGLVDATPASYTWTVLPPQTCPEANGTAAVDADAWIDEHAPIDNNGDDSILKVMSKAPSENSRAVVRFTLPQAPAGCLVESATLRLYSDSAPDVPRTLHALRLTSAWNENSVTWGNQPATAGPAAEAPAAMGYVQWNVTSQVQAMYSGDGNHGFLVRHAIENDPASAEESFFSKEKLENPPELLLTFTGPPPVEAPPPVPPPVEPPPVEPLPPVEPPPSVQSQPPGTRRAPVAPVIGRPLGPTVAQLVAALKGDLRTAARTLRRLGIAAIVRGRGANVKRVHALIPGTVRISTVIGGRRVVVLRGTRKFARAGKATLRLKLTKRGRQVLERKSSAKLTLRGSFANRRTVIRAPNVKVTLKRRGLR
jgi:hypothetical protein